MNYPLKSFKRKVIVIVHRNDDIEEKWIVTPENISFTKEKIMRQIKFQEKYFDSYINYVKDRNTKNSRNAD